MWRVCITFDGTGYSLASFDSYPAASAWAARIGVLYTDGNVVFDVKIYSEKFEYKVDTSLAAA